MFGIRVEVGSGSAAQFGVRRGVGIAGAAPTPPDSGGSSALGSYVYRTMPAGLYRQFPGFTYRKLPTG